MLMDYKVYWARFARFLLVWAVQFWLKEIVHAYTIRMRFIWILVKLPSWAGKCIYMVSKHGNTWEYSINSYMFGFFVLLSHLCALLQLLNQELSTIIMKQSLQIPSDCRTDSYNYWTKSYQVISWNNLFEYLQTVGLTMGCPKVQLTCCSKINK